MTEERSEPAARRVALFVTCLVDALFPQVGLAAASLLERHGVEVVCPDVQTCCGQPAFNAGHRRHAQTVARHFLDVFQTLLERRAVDAIVAPSGSCVAMVRHHYPALFRGADESQRRRLQLVSEATYELTEYLVDVLGVTRIEASLPATIVYHPCCHLKRELKVDSQPRQLLAGIADAKVVALAGEEDCCGFGGLFALKNAEISTAMGRRKATNIAAARAEYVVVNDVSCMAHINGILSRRGADSRAVHIAEVLHRVPDQESGKPHDR